MWHIFMFSYSGKLSNIRNWILKENLAHLLGRSQLLGLYVCICSKLVNHLHLQKLIFPWFFLALLDLDSFVLLSSLISFLHGILFFWLSNMSVPPTIKRTDLYSFSLSIPFPALASFFCHPSFSTYCFNFYLGL